MEHITKSVTQSPDYRPGGVGEWIAALVVWCAAIAMSLAIVCFLLTSYRLGNRSIDRWRICRHTEKYPRMVKFQTFLQIGKRVMLGLSQSVLLTLDRTLPSI